MGKNINNNNNRNDCDEDEKWDTKNLNSFTHQISPLFGTSPIVIRQDSSSGYHGFTVWDSAKVFLGYLEKMFLSDLKKRKKINIQNNNNNDDELTTGRKLLVDLKWIELGAGCGLVSAGLIRFNIKHLVITEQPDVLPYLSSNIALNTQIMVGDSLISIDEVQKRVRVKPLYWGNRRHCEDCGGPFDRIVATDVIFEKDNLPFLISTLIDLSKSGTEIHIGHENRDTEVIKAFMQLVEETRLFTPVMTVSKGKYHSNWIRDLINVYTFKRI